MTATLTTSLHPPARRDVPDPQDLPRDLAESRARGAVDTGLIKVAGEWFVEHGYPSLLYP